MRIIIDFDDCICHGFPQNPVPDITVVEGLRRISRCNPETIITIHTARGQVSCFGNPEKASEKYRNLMEEFLKKNEVPYSEIIFGKPFGDVYIDDKAISSREFSEGSFDIFSGNSGADCCRVGDMFIKIYHDNQKKAKYEQEWYYEFKKHFANDSLFDCPDVISYSYNTIHMKFIKGKTLYRNNNKDWFIRLFDYIDKEREICLEGGNDVSSFVDYIQRKGEDLSVCLSQEEKDELLTNNEIKRRTFCHGDITQQNVIVGEDGLLYLIDPGYDRGVMSWIQDLGKLRASICGLDDAILGRKVNVNEQMLSELDERFREHISLAKIFQKTHCIRVAHTNLDNGKTENIQTILGVSYA